jgi:iron complex outermembrane recepter protein
MTKPPDLSSNASCQLLGTSLRRIQPWKILVLWGVAFAGTAVSAAARAVTIDEPASPQLEEIIVTATKRTSTLQETPISITAVTGEGLLARGVSDINTLMDQTPGVSFQTLGPGRTNFNIRGLSDAGGSSPTVGFYLDDVPITPATSVNTAAGKSEISPDLYDLQRIEVLRGPQGTLYGAGSEGGTIRLLANQPKLNEFEASGQVILSNTDHSNGVNHTENGMVNLPLIDQHLALRLVVSDKFDDGYIDRVVVSPFPQYTNGFTQRGEVAAAPVQKVYDDVNTAHTTAVRALLLWEPIENLTVTPSIVTQKVYQGGQNSIDLPPGNFAHYQPGDIPEQYNERIDLYALTVKFKLGSVQMQSTTSQMYINTLNVEDVWEQLSGSIVPSGSPFLTQGNAYEQHRQRQLSEELRFSSSEDQALQWIVGGFYNDFKDASNFQEISSQLSPYYGEANLYTDYEPDHLKQSAVFGEATYAILPTLKATAGARYFHYDFDFLQNDSGIVTAPPFLSTGSAAATGTTPKVGLSYLPTTNLTVFANVAKGFRPGSANLPIPPVYCGVDLQGLGATTYKPDSVWSYEIGEKARMLDGAVGLRTSAYYINWKDIQQAVPLACGYAYTTNAGAASSKGGELELDAKLTQTLALHESLGYTDAKITSSSADSAIEVGSPLANVPRWTIYTGLENLSPLANGWKLGMRADDEYTGSEFDPNAQPYPLNRRGGYNIFNARMGVEGHDFTAYVFASNLLNKVAYLGFDRSEAVNSPIFARVIPTVPRTIGLDVQVHF